MEPTTVLCLFLRLRIPVVGWPPIRSFPKNTLSSTSAKNNGQTEEKSGVACLYVKKVDSENDKGFQQFLDNVRYKANGILRYERVFGPGYVSTGGVE